MSRLEQCRLCEVLGRGSFGKVFRGELRDPSTGIDECAVKICDVDNAHDHAVVLREVALLRRASVHPNVVRFFGVLGLGSSVQVYLELCLCSLADLVRERGAPLPELIISAAVHSVAEGLHFLHTELNTVHRDVKGANILLSTSGVIKLTDFNVSATLSTSRPACASATGTPQWMAPEVIMGEQYAQAADMWSLGVTVLELADGTVPHYCLDPMAAMFRIVTLPPPCLLSPQLHSLAFDAMVRALLNKNARERPSAAQLLGCECLRACGSADERALVLCQLAFEYRQHQAFLSAAARVPLPPSSALAIDSKRVSALFSRDPGLDAERKRLRGPDGPVRLSDEPPAQQPANLTLPAGAPIGSAGGSAGHPLQLLEGLNPTGLCLSTPPSLVDVSGASWDERYKTYAERGVAELEQAHQDEFDTTDPGTTPPPSCAPDEEAYGCEAASAGATGGPRRQPMEADFVNSEGHAFVVMPPLTAGALGEGMAPPLTCVRESGSSTELCSTMVVVVEDYYMR